MDGSALSTIAGSLYDCSTDVISLCDTDILSLTSECPQWIYIRMVTSRIALSLADPVIGAHSVAENDVSFRRRWLLLLIAISCRPSTFLVITVCTVEREKK